MCYDDLLTTRAVAAVVVVRDQMHNVGPRSPLDIVSTQSCDNACYLDLLLTVYLVY